ncbi:metallophosphoesterase family protein [Thermus scotoductus]|uniref:Metallophosphatase family protein n=1 Tax=Thermus scotoductus TaxID=37636 RepID=A0A430V4A2_THESC|nr:metallophosphoesterase family protein [Thermus scotoductus]RTH14611.1 metallophosphatase family protein [Thermus scotoductus]RTI17974.1 metallophosphatase family protein [Thermus scotoductus]
MRLGVLSDIHANLPALEAALEALRDEGVDEALVLGDLVGYGPHPRQVIRRLLKEGLPAIAGAWDLRVAYPLPGTLPEGVGKATLEWTRSQLAEKELDYLRSLRLSHRKIYGERRLVAFHGTPGNPESHLDLLGPANPFVPLLERYSAAVLLLGGRHLPLSRRVGMGLVADPGSVGLSLSGEPGADAMILDTETLEVHFLKVPYDLGPLIFDLRAWGLPPVLEKVYRTGRFPKED